MKKAEKHCSRNAGETGRAPGGVVVEGRPGELKPPGGSLPFPGQRETPVPPDVELPHTQHRATVAPASWSGAWP